MSAEPAELYSKREIIDLAAADSLFFSRVFFPQTFRQPSPLIHSQVWDLLDSPEYQYVGLELFRGSGKTTIIRANIAKRISYGISRVILPVSASVSHAARTVRWVKKQVESNALWTQTFGIRKGKKWTDEELEIYNEISGTTAYVLAVGILGQVRGVNLEDYRPDFIIADDPCDEENSGTEDQREKTAALFFGALAPSLAPRSEVAWSKMALLQTGLADGPNPKDKDLIATAHTDPQWHTVRFPILDEKGESVWPERWSTKEVLEMKAAYTRRGQLHLWMREFECSIISPEEAPLKPELLKYYQSPPESMVVYIGLDPAREKSKMPHKTCMSVIGVSGKNRYLLDYYSQKSVNPEEIWAEFYRLAMKWRPYQVGVETIAYQQMLAWYFRKKMQEVGNYWMVREVEDRRKKRDRILQEIAGLTAAGLLYVDAGMSEWIGAYRNWRVSEDNDLLDSTALALALSGNLILGPEGSYDAMPILDESNIPDLEIELGCP